MVKFCLLHKVICDLCLYISLSSFLKITQADNFVPFSQISFVSFPIKNLFLRARALGFIRFGDLSLHTTETNGLSYLGRGAQSNFPTNVVGRFLSKNNVYALQPRLYLSSPNLFSLFLLYDIYCIVDLCDVNKIISLLLFCYLIQDYASSSYLFLSFFYFIFLTVVSSIQG